MDILQLDTKEYTFIYELEIIREGDSSGNQAKHLTAVSLEQNYQFCSKFTRTQLRRRAFGGFSFLRSQLNCSNLEQMSGLLLKYSSESLFLSSALLTLAHKSLSFCYTAYVNKL